MNSLLGTDWSARDCHPTEDDLLYYVDGELAAKEAAKLRAHLEACWSCRVRTEEIEKTIASFVHFLNKSVASNIGPPPHGWQALDARMARLAAEAGARPLLFQWFDSLKRVSLGWPLPRSLALGALVILFVVSLVVRFDKVPPVSASQLIQKVTDANDHRLLSVVQPVIHQKLKVQRKATSYSHEGVATWEIWNDTGHNRFKQRAEGRDEQRNRESAMASTTPHNRPSIGSLETTTPGSRDPAVLKKTGLLQQPLPDSPTLPIVLEELAQVFEANRMDPHSPLSSVSFGAWRESIQRKSETIQEISLPGGSEALTLTTDASGPFAVNAIIQGQLVVRHSDWHPVEQHLKIQGEKGILDYALTEEAFEVVPWGGLPPMLFADLTPQTSPKVAATAPSTPPIVPPALVPIPSELTAAEVEAMLALHRVKACLGGMNTVTRSSMGRIEVHGVVDSAERKEEILAALQGIPWVDAKILTVEEAVNSTPLALPDPNASQNEAEISAPGQPETTEVLRGKLPIQDLLEKYFTETRQAVSAGPNKSAGAAQQITELSNRAVSLSEAALEEAWALRRLAEWSSSLKADELRPSARYVLEVMIRDHITELWTKINNFRQLLEPVLSSILPSGPGTVVAMKDMPAPSSSVAENTSWTSDSLRLFAKVERIVHLSLSLFADSSFQPEQREAAMRELQMAFGQWESEFQTLEARVDKTFQGKPDSLTLKGLAD